MLEGICTVATLSDLLTLGAQTQEGDWREEGEWKKLRRRKRLKNVQKTKRRQEAEEAAQRSGKAPPARAQRRPGGVARRPETNVLAH